MEKESLFFSDKPCPSDMSTESTSTLTAPTTTTTTTTTTSTSSERITDAVFAKSSFWYTPIPLNAPIHANSANFVNEFIRQKNTYYNNVNINTNSYSSPVYIVDSSVPTTTVGFNNCQKKTYIDSTFTNMMSAVPIPDYAKQSPGTDGEMTIYQPSTNTIWEMWVSYKDVSGKWFACWGGS